MRECKVRSVHGINILIVEDDDLIQIATQKILAKFGCKVAVADSGREAVRLFKNNNYNLVLLDIAIGDMDGFTIAENFREEEKRQERKGYVPILAVSAYDDDSFKKRAMAVGINHYLIKPVTSNKYKELLENFFPDEILAE
jgi:two-component system, OmpR family, aerobic respiration control sensor histidine kinase ArcB